MRLCFALLASLSLVACGGGDDADRADAGPRPDARADAEAAPDCLFGTEYGLILGDPDDPEDFGGAAFGQDDAGNWVVAVYGGLDSLEGEPASFGHHGLTILLVDNTGMFLDNAPFGSGAVGTALTVDGIEENDDCGGCLYGYSGMPSSEPPADPGNVPTQAFLADSGTLTFTTFDDVVDGQASAISATYEGVMMTGYDYATGEALTPACTSNVSLEINFLVTFSSTGVAPFSKDTQPVRATQPIRVVRK